MPLAVLAFAVLDTRMVILVSGSEFSVWALLNFITNGLFCVSNLQLTKIFILLQTELLMLPTQAIYTHTHYTPSKQGLVAVGCLMRLMHARLCLNISSYIKENSLSGVFAQTDIVYNIRHRCTHCMEKLDLWAG